LRRHFFPIQCRFPSRAGTDLTDQLRRPIIVAHDQITSTRAGLGPADPEERAHRSFAALRRRAYLEIPVYLERLDRHVHDDGSAIAVVGASGAGKSALIAYWADRFRRNHPTDFLIEHYVGAAAASSDRHAILRRIITAIRERYRLEDPVPVGAAEIEESFPLWLGHVQRERLVIAIDALDQLDGSGSAAWLPEYLPPSVRLIITSTETPLLEELRERGWPELRVEPLTLGQRREIVRSFLGEISTSFTAEQIRSMSRGTASANPLFLRTRLEELRQFGAGGPINRRIDGYLAAGDLDELYQHVLERLESGFGEDRVRDVMLLVASSRRGLSARELAGLVGCRESDLAPLLDGLIYHLSKRDGLYSFFHDYLRRAVRTRYRVGPESLAAVRLHRRIAGHFAGGPLDERRAEEEPWQLLRACAWDLLRLCIVDIPMFGRLKEGPGGYQLLSYWLAIGSRYDMSSSYEESLRAYEEQAGTGPELADALADVGAFLAEAGRYEAAERCCRRALDLRERMRGPVHADTATVLDRLVMILYHTGRIEEAGGLARRALAIREELFGETHSEVVESLAHVGALLHAAGAFDDAESLLRRGLDLCRRSGAGDTVLTAKILNNLGAVMIARRSFDEAAGHIERAIDINGRALGEGHPEVASNMVNLAFILGEQRQYAAAEQSYRRALAIGESVLGPEHPRLAVILTNLGSMLRESGDLASAESPFRRALSIRERALGMESVETLNSMIRLGFVLKRRGEIAEACRLYAAALDGLRAELGAEHPQVLRIGEVLEEMHELT
jgi:tetratricopeptide (TPR) repeat protein